MFVCFSLCFSLCLCVNVKNVDMNVGTELLSACTPMYDTSDTTSEMAILIGVICMDINMIVSCSHSLDTMTCDVIMMLFIVSDMMHMNAIDTMFLLIVGLLDCGLCLAPLAR